MKVFIDYDINESGKGKFLQRLIPALEKLGIESGFEKKGCDVALGIARWRNKINIPRVLRVDGIHLNGDDKRDKWINEKIKKSIEKSDAVIFQSRFARKMVVEKLNPLIRKDYVIYNGANPDDYDVEPIETGYSRNIIASAKWCNRHGLRKAKGLKQAIKKLLEFKNENTGLFIAGEVPNKYKVEGITFLGKLEEHDLQRWLRTCENFIYMAKYDWCPNSIVEAIVAGCGIIYNKKCEAVEELMQIKRESLYIDNIARKYATVFEETVK